MSFDVLALDANGEPRTWISYDDAISYHATDSVAWSLGNIIRGYRGGFNNNGVQSFIETTSIIAIKGGYFDQRRQGRVALTNKTLFGRDRNICAYCGNHFQYVTQLSRDHIMPRSRGGVDDWMNVVTACKRCNTHKGNMTLKEANLELHYVPYIPNHNERLIIQNRNILADQMEYLLAGVPRHSRLAA